MLNNVIHEATKPAGIVDVGVYKGWNPNYYYGIPN